MKYKFKDIRYLILAISAAVIVLIADHKHYNISIAFILLAIGFIPGLLFMQNKKQKIIVSITQEISFVIIIFYYIFIIFFNKA